MTPDRKGLRDFPASELWAGFLDGAPERPIKPAKKRGGKRRLSPEEALALAFQQMEDGTLYREGGNKR